MTKQIISWLNDLGCKLYLIVTCPDLSLPNGQVSFDTELVDDQHPVNTTATFTCDDGYYPVGEDSTCEPSGNWSQPTLSCIGNKNKIINIFLLFINISLFNK